MTDSNSPILPVPEFQKPQPFQLPEVPDPSGIIMKAAELQQQERALKQKKVDSLAHAILSYAGLGQKAEMMRLQRESPAAVLDLLLKKDKLDKAPLQKQLLEAKTKFFGERAPIGEEKRIVEQGELNKFKGNLVEAINTLKDFPAFVPVLGKFGRQVQNIVSDFSAGQYAPAMQKWKTVKPTLAAQSRRLFAEKDARMSDADQKLALKAIDIENVSPEVASIKLGFFVRAMDTAQKNIDETRRMGIAATPGFTPSGLSKTLSQKEAIALSSAGKKTLSPKERYVELEGLFGENNDDMIVPIMTDEGYFVK